MSDIVTYEGPTDGVAVITLDDGKVNVLSPTMLSAINEAFDQAERDDVITVLAGRTGIFSGGFDLKVMTQGPHEANAMTTAGFDLAERILGLRRPVVAACTGHAIAMGAFLCLSTDYRIGTDGPFRVVANEVAIGMTLPRGIIELCRAKLATPLLGRVMTQAEPFSGAAAVAAGFFDELAAPEDVITRARARAAQLCALDARAVGATKSRVFAADRAAIRAAFEQDELDAAEVLGG